MIAGLCSLEKRKKVSFAGLRGAHLREAKGAAPRGRTLGLGLLCVFFFFFWGGGGGWGFAFRVCGGGRVALAGELVLSGFGSFWVGEERLRG